MTLETKSRDLIKDIELTDEGIIYWKHNSNGTFEKWIIPKELILAIFNKYVINQYVSETILMNENYERKIELK